MFEAGRAATAALEAAGTHSSRYGDARRCTSRHCKTCVICENGGYSTVAHNGSLSRPSWPPRVICEKFPENPLSKPPGGVVLHPRQEVSSSRRCAGTHGGQDGRRQFFRKFRENLRFLAQSQPRLHGGADDDPDRAGQLHCRQRIPPQIDRVSPLTGAGFAQ